jgi:RNA polymerase sigma-70 factor (ECF subfamily)
MADFAEVLALQIPGLWRYARALTQNVAWADDLVQDTLECALHRRWLFRLNSNLSAWLFTMLYRLYLNDAARHRMVPLADDAQIPEPATRDYLNVPLGTAKSRLTRARATNPDQAR